MVVSSEGVKRGKRGPRIFTAGAPPTLTCSFPPLGCGHRAGSINSAGTHGGVDVTIRRNVTPPVTIVMFIRPTLMFPSSCEPRVIMYGRVSSVRQSGFFFWYLGDSIQENKMGGACGTWGRGEKDKKTYRVLVGRH